MIFLRISMLKEINNELGIINLIYLLLLHTKYVAPILQLLNLVALLLMLDC